MNRRSFTKVLGLIAAAPKLVKPQELQGTEETLLVTDEIGDPPVAASQFGHRVSDPDLGKMSEAERREFFRIIERDAKDQLPFARTYFREYVEGERHAK